MRARLAPATCAHPIQYCWSDSQCCEIFTPVGDSPDEFGVCFFAERKRNDGERRGLGGESNLERSLLYFPWKLLAGATEKAKLLPCLLQ